MLPSNWRNSCSYCTLDSVFMHWNAHFFEWWSYQSLNQRSNGGRKSKEEKKPLHLLWFFRPPFRNTGFSQNSVWISNHAKYWLLHSFLGDPHQYGVWKSWKTDFLRKYKMAVSNRIVHQRKTLQYNKI